MRRNLLLGSCLALALATAACQDQQTEPSSIAPELSQKLRSKTSALTRQLDRRLKLPPGPLSDQYLRRLASRAINPGDYECPPSTPFVDFLFASLDPIDPAVLNELFGLAADVLPTAYALILDTEANPQYFGYNGEYNHIMIKTERDVKRFWDIPSADIQLLGMHGTLLLDVNKVAATYQAAFTLDDGSPIPPALARALAEAVRAAVLADPDLNRGNHPLFTFNAFAFSDFAGPIPDKIVMGDGALDALASIGFEDVAPQGMYAHEFAHHIQYENGYRQEIPPGATTAAEFTRYQELMADAYSAYYLTHKRGAALNKHRVAQFFEVFFNIGDCAFTNAGHHGTPNQRRRAAQFGFNVADQAQKQGHILSSDAFHDLFVAAYPRIVAPDAT